MTGWTQTVPNAVTLLLAVALAVIVGLMSAPDDASGFVASRMCFAAALVCLWQDSLAAARILAPARDFKNPDRWVLAGQYAWYFGSFLFLATWQDLSDPVASAWGAAVLGILYGALMGLGLKGPEETEESRARFDLDRPITGTPAGRVLYRLWPLVMAAALALALSFPPEVGWDPRHLGFLIVLSPSVMVPYRPIRGFGPMRSAWVPRILGLLLLMAGLFVAG